MGKTVERILNKPHTKMPVNFVNAHNWNWPEAQGALLNTLLKDKMIETHNDVIFNKERDAIFVNGKKVSASKKKTYNAILKRYEFSDDFEFSFYKKDNHIVIVDDLVQIEPLLKDMVAAGLLKSAKNKIEIKINGDAVFIGDNKLSQPELARLNDLLMSHKIILAPGKIVKIASSKNLILGYQLDKATLGTWLMKD
jgi:hypothetical protein